MKSGVGVANNPGACNVFLKVLFVLNHAYQTYPNVQTSGRRRLFSYTCNAGFGLSIESVS